MEPILIAFGLADVQNCRYAGDDIEMSGLDRADGARVLARLTEADAMAATMTAIGEGTAYLKVTADRIIERVPARRAVIERRNATPTPAAVAAYLFGNFEVASHDDRTIVVTGHDLAGFTLEAQRDRLASGLIGARIEA